MIADINSKPENANGTISFVPGDGVHEADYNKFLSDVNAEASAICTALVLELKERGLKAYSQQSKGAWEVVAGHNPTATLGDPDPNAPPPPRTIIRIRANTVDIPPIVNALETFFGNWRAVAGLVVSVAAFVGGAWVMTVRRGH